MGQAKAAAPLVLTGANVRSATGLVIERHLGASSGIALIETTITSREAR